MEFQIAVSLVLPEQMDQHSASFCYQVYKLFRGDWSGVMVVMVMCYDGLCLGLVLCFVLRC
jgi:hypothetical protein